MNKIKVPYLTQQDIEEYNNDEFHFALNGKLLTIWGNGIARVRNIEIKNKSNFKKLLIWLKII